MKIRISLISYLIVLGSLLVTPGVNADESRADGGANQALKEAAKKLAAGTERLGEIHIGRLGHRQSTTIEVQLDRARCYKFILVGGTGADDLSLAVRAYGKEVASDRTSGEQPVAEWCSKGRVKATVKITLYSGSGAYALGIYGQKTDVPRSAEKVGGNGKDFIANRIRQLHGQFGKGRAAISHVFKGNLSTGGEKVFNIRLKAGHCYTIIGAGAPSVRNLDILLLRKNGSELSADKTKNNFPHFDTEPCPRAGGQFKLKVKMFSGFGQFGLQVFSD